jgi:hypothetical protein
MKVIVAGSRGFDDYTLLSDELNKLQHLLKSMDKSITEIVSGTARGADKLGERWADENNVCIKKFPADWNTYGKSAGYIRNQQMAEYADVLYAFWDGKSKGTKHMIDLAHKHNLKVRVISYGR